MKPSKAFDVNGVELQHGDYVQLLVDNKFNKKLRKGCVVRVSHWGDRIGVIIWLMGKGAQKVYNNGMEGHQLVKVNWCEKKRRIIA